MEPLYDPVSVQEENYFEVILKTRQENADAREKLDLSLRDLALRPAISVTPNDSIKTVIQMMRINRIGSALVTVDGKLAGIFTERDVLDRVILEDIDLANTPVSYVMTSRPETLGLYDSVSFAINLMSDCGYRHVPVTDQNGRPLHVVSIRDIAGFLADCYPECVRNLPPQAGQWAETRNGG